MPAQKPENREASDEVASAKSPGFVSKFQSKIPILNQFSRSFFLYVSASSVILIVLFIFFIIPSGFPKVTKLVHKENSVVATVNGQKIFRKDYEAILEAQQYFYTNIYPKETQDKVSDEFLQSLSQTTLDNLILENLLTQYLATKDIHISVEEIRQEIKVNVVNPSWKGDWSVYEQFLRANGTNLENQLHTYRRDLAIRKVIQMENLKPYDFDKWYENLKAKSKISSFVDQK